MMAMPTILTTAIPRCYDLLATVWITLLFTGATFLLLESIEIAFVSAVLALICIVAPAWKFWLQSYKITLRGPWDIAHVSSN